MKGHEHKYISGTIDDECDFCGLLKSTIYSMENQNREQCGKMTVDAFGGNPHPCPITKPCGKHNPVIEATEGDLNRVLDYMWQSSPHNKERIKKEVADKIEEWMSEMWDDGVSFGVYQMREVIEEVKTRYKNEDYNAALRDVSYELQKIYNKYCK